MSDIAEIAALWGAVDIRPNLIAARENHVYDVTIDGFRRALRVHRPGYQSRLSIDSELRWTDRLAQVGFPCPRPVVSGDGSFLRSVAGGGYASVVAWIDGQPIHEVPADDPVALYTGVGALIAALHDATDEVDTHDIQRLAWDADALLGEAPLWGRFWENPTLTDSESEALLLVRARAYELLIDMPTPDAGLIHADCLQENILATQTGLNLIDFDDAGFGYRAYDLGTALIQHWDNPRLPALRQALIKGYGSLRAAPSEEHVVFFTMLRGLASCGWAISRLSGNMDAQRAMADRALGTVATWRALAG